MSQTYKIGINYCEIINQLLGAKEMKWRLYDFKSQGIRTMQLRWSGKLNDESKIEGDYVVKEDFPNVGMLPDDEHLVYLNRAAQLLLSEIVLKHFNP